MGDRCGIGWELGPKRARHPISPRLRLGFTHDSFIQPLGALRIASKGHCKPGAARIELGMLMVQPQVPAELLGGAGLGHLEAGVGFAEQRPQPL